ncbi:hypothetical protein ASE86_09660 [Sphingomonas sp. Leaf33]|uniref:exonuclease domain-containing protein n=1 Tax=Sphingomonas sp. Leaf33 TaxID=1736215 RepID=UPI0006F629F5|nr:exonuclease domain-containing protein [Sphingomonas sp. Leaf33]KQN26372.1 hypothetical protein ASE86_09660 [Sphingomonas sp. Leaf33]
MKLYDQPCASAAMRLHVQALEARAEDYRVLHRLPHADEIWLSPTPSTGTVTIGVVDVETTGLTENDQMVELALAKVVIGDGQIVDLKPPISMLEDPGQPLSDAVKHVTRLEDEDLHGQRFDEDLLAVEMGDVDVLVAFNAAFDARFVRERFPGIRHPWVCALRDFDWAGAGYHSRNQGGLLAELGHFYTAHRAAADAWALLVLIANSAPDGRAIAAHLVERGQRTDVRLSASGAPFQVKDDLKAAGYRWQADRRVWRIDVAEADASAQVDFLRALHPSIRPVVEVVDWYNRHCC